MISQMKSKFLAVIMMLLLTSGITYAQSNDEDPPEITNVQVTDLEDDKVTITWETDEDADSIVNYGLKEDYGIVRVPEANKQEHSITLEGLEKGRVYHFRVISSDEEGNQGISADYKVQLGEPATDDSDGQGDSDGDGQSDSTSTTQIDPETIEEVKRQIQQITDPQLLREILNETIKAIQGVTEDLTIVGPPTVTPETTSALIEWSTDRPASSEVVFAPASEYSEGNYTLSQSDPTGANTQQHSIRLIGLEPFTEYHFKVRSTDEYGITGESFDYTFKTKASLPEIRNLRIVKVEENAATLAWDTTVPSKALVEYQDLTTGLQNSKGRPTLLTSHQMRLDDLTLGTRYVSFVIAENGGGDRVKSQPITFITVKDTAPPFISNVTNESTIFPGGESRIQTIVEWTTDEPAYCMMTYREGVAGGVEPTIIEDEQISYAEKHVEVIVDFAPATVYQFWLDCADEAGNTRKSENFVLFTPIQEKNIIDLILENFESTFGWVKNISG
jgi:hypothetical protein